MNLSGEYNIPATKNKVWEYLNNPETLKKSIKGCESLEKISENEFNAKVKTKIGPVSATFNGSVKLTDIKAPNSYVINGQGKGGAAGFAKGSVKINLSENNDGTTLLSYSGNSQVGGKLAQLGSRLIDGAVKNTADDFFSKFCTLVTDPLQAEESKNIDNQVDNNENIKKESKLTIPYWGWIISLITVIFIIITFFI
tara:strand:- start:5676 stop:6266 length:591 start_codon:yes stop_codon:yes gene_type:complete